MKTLYSADDDKVIDLLRKAIHVKNLDIAGSHVINTGYLFEIHTETTFELFYNIWDEILVFQPFLPNSIRGIAGLFANSANGKYFDRYGPKAIVKLKNDASEWHEMNIEEIL